MSLLPKELAYLEPAAKELAKLSPDELDEGADFSKLETALRQRINGLELRDAIALLDKDQAILQQWQRVTKTREDIAFWVAGYFARTGPTARRLLAPPDPPDPTVSIEMADGWDVKEFPLRLDLFSGKVFCSITIMDKRWFEMSRQKNLNRKELQDSSKNPWANLGIWTRATVEFGPCHGEKGVYSQEGKTNWKSLDYLLEVPGGYVGIRLGHEKGKDFDEMEFEKKFHTLKVIPPPSSPN
jgi:hypothetical protein